MINCQFCGKEIENKRHEGLCGKNPQRRGIKKGGKHKTHNIHKTTGKKSVTITSSAVGSVLPAAPVESQKNKLTEVNLKKEYDKMTETLNPKKKNSKEKKYQCGACGATFDNLNEGKCPDCGEQLA